MAFICLLVCNSLLGLQSWNINWEMYGNASSLAPCLHVTDSKVDVCQNGDVLFFFY